MSRIVMCPVCGSPARTKRAANGYLLLERHLGNRDKIPLKEILHHKLTYCFNEDLSEEDSHVVKKDK